MATPYVILGCCDTCRYYDGDYGCHFNPPTHLADNIKSVWWPTVGPSDWCGKFSAFADPDDLGETTE